MQFIEWLKVCLQEAHACKELLHVCSSENGSMSACRKHMHVRSCYMYAVQRMAQSLPAGSTCM